MTFLSKYWYPFLLFFFTSVVIAQQPNTKSPDSVDQLLEEARILAYNDINRAFEILDKADSIARKHNSLQAIAEVAHIYAVAHYVKGTYDQSLHNYLDAQEKFSQDNNHLGVAKCLIGQGLIQQGIDRHREAINFFEQAIEAYLKSGNPATSSPAYINIAISKMEQGKNPAARKSLEKAIELSQITGRKDIIHLAWNKIAEINFLEGNLDQAFNYYRKVLNDSDQPNSWEKSFAHAGLAQTYREQDQLDLAEAHGLKAIDYAQRSESLWDLERNTNILSQIYHHKGETEKELEQLKKNIKYRDSLYNQKKLREINLLQLESKEAENSRLKAEKSITDQKLFIYRAGLIIVIIIALFLLLLFVLYRKNIKQKLDFASTLEQKNATITEQNKLILERNNELDESNQAKNQMFSVLSHDLRSPLGALQQLLELMKTNEFNKEEQENLLDEMYQQVRETSS